MMHPFCPVSLAPFLATGIGRLVTKAAMPALCPRVCHGPGTTPSPPDGLGFDYYIPLECLQKERQERNQNAFERSDGRRRKYTWISFIGCHPVSAQEVPNSGQDDCGKKLVDLCAPSSTGGCRENKCISVRVCVCVLPCFNTDAILNNTVEIHSQVLLNSYWLLPLCILSVTG